jgi:hypothetical protein
VGTIAELLLRLLLGVLAWPGATALVALRCLQVWVGGLHEGERSVVLPRWVMLGVLATPRGPAALLLKWQSILLKWQSILLKWQSILLKWQTMLSWGSHMRRGCTVAGTC